MKLTDLLANPERLPSEGILQGNKVSSFGSPSRSIHRTPDMIFQSSICFCLETASKYTAQLDEMGFVRGISQLVAQCCHLFK